MAFTEKQNNPAAVVCVDFFVSVWGFFGVCFVCLFSGFFLLAISSHWIQQLRTIHDSKLLLC